MFSYIARGACFRLHGERLRRGALVFPDLSLSHSGYYRFWWCWCQPFGVSSKQHTHTHTPVSDFRSKKRGKLRSEVSSHGLDLLDVTSHGEGRVWDERPSRCCCIFYLFVSPRVESLAWAWWWATSIYMSANDYIEQRLSRHRRVSLSPASFFSSSLPNIPFVVTWFI